MALTIVALILFSMGLTGIISDCMRNSSFVIPSYNFLNLIAGIGLLKLWRGARWYSNCLFGCSFMIMIPISVWFLYNPEKIVIRFPSILIDDRPHAIGSLLLATLIMLGYIILSGWMLFVLNRRDVRELFQHKINLPTPSVPM
jgi:hypothetical protein